jgi:hypothetical protein
MLTIKCETNTGAWHSKYTGVNYKIYRLPRAPPTSGSNICMRDLRDLVAEKLKCTTISCIQRIVALECAVYEHCDTISSESIAGIETLRRNLNCKKLSLPKESEHTSEVPQRDVVATGNRWGFFTGDSSKSAV